MFFDNMSDVTLIPIVIDPAQYLITCLIFTMKNHSTIKIALTIVKLLQIYFVELVFFAVWQSFIKKNCGLYSLAERSL